MVQVLAGLAAKLEHPGLIADLGDHHLAPEVLSQRLAGGDLAGDALFAVNIGAIGQGERAGLGVAAAMDNGNTFRAQPGQGLIGDVGAVGEDD